MFGFEDRQGLTKSTQPPECCYGSAEMIKEEALGFSLVPAREIPEASTWLSVANRFGTPTTTDFGFCSN